MSEPPPEPPQSEPPAPRYPYSYLCEDFVTHAWDKVASHDCTLTPGKTHLICVDKERGIGLLGRFFHEYPYDCTVAYGLGVRADMQTHLSRLAYTGANRLLKIYLDEHRYILFTFIHLDADGKEDQTKYAPSLEKGAEWPDIYEFIPGEKSMLVDRQTYR